MKKSSSGVLNFPAKARGGTGKTFLYLIAATGVASLTVRSLNSNPNPIHFFSLPSPTDFPFLNGVVRSSRALFTITSTVIDYKYSLHGLLPGTDEYQHELSEVHLRSAKRILQLCEGNKGFYVKAGQFAAAMRQVPREYSSTLSSLRDQVVPCQFKVIKEVLVNNLGPHLSDIFLSFDEQPIAAASIAQVHHAVMKDHQEVAVKVQYPGLEYQMKFDLATMSFLSKSVSWICPEYRFEWLVVQFAKSVTSELDFIQEAKNSERMAENFQNNKMVVVPRIFWDFTTSQVLTMQFCKGQKVNDLEFLKQKGISPFKVANVLAEVFAEMIFVHGFLHGDLHPGNVLVSPEGVGGFSLVLLDHGICKELNEDFRVNYCQLWKALVFMDSYQIQEIGENFGVGKYSRYFPVIFTGRTLNSKSALGKGMSVEEKKNLKEEVKSLKVEDISSFMESLPPDFLTVLRTDGLLRSLISNLGAPQQARLLAYTKYALHGLSLKSNSAYVHAVFSRFKNDLKYIQLRLLLDLLMFVSYMDGIKRAFTQRLKQYYAFVGYLVRNLFPLPGGLIL